MTPHQWVTEWSSEEENLAVIACTRCGIRTDVLSSWLGTDKLEKALVQRVKGGFVMDCDVSLVNEVMGS